MPAPKGLAALALTDAAAAGRKLRAVIRSLKGDLAAAARALDVHPATLERWLAAFPGGKTQNTTFATCRQWVDERYPQRNNPRKMGRRRANEKKDARPP